MEQNVAAGHARRDPILAKETIDLSPKAHIAPLRWGDSFRMISRRLDHQAIMQIYRLMI